MLYRCVLFDKISVLLIADLLKLIARDAKYSRTRKSWANLRRGLQGTGAAKYCIMMLGCRDIVCWFSKKDSLQPTVKKFVEHARKKIPCKKYSVINNYEYVLEVWLSTYLLLIRIKTA